MTAHAAFLLVVATSFVAAEPQPARGAVPAELQGTWRLASADAGGAALPLPDPKPVLVVEGGRLLYGGEEIARVSADPSTDPKVIDLRFRGPDRVYEGIYAVKEGELKVCLNGRSEGLMERPGVFSAEGQPGWRLLTFRREERGAEGASGFVGVVLRFDAHRREVLIDDALDGSPAKKAGLRKGDVLLDVGGAAVTDLLAAVDA
ncbi:MAG TPA: TIGR03067 domain-containing protein, partial [Gemmataceae bacterium]